jgi:sulfonate dioxygenase
LHLFAVAKAVDLTESIGTVLEGVQLSQLNEAQLDELALLVSERGVVFFRNQDLTTEQQEKLFSHYGTSRVCGIEIILTPLKAF